MFQAWLKVHSDAKKEYETIIKEADPILWKTIVLCPRLRMLRLSEQKQLHFFKDLEQKRKGRDGKKKEEKGRKGRRIESGRKTKKKGD